MDGQQSGFAHFPQSEVAQACLTKVLGSPQAQQVCAAALRCMIAIGRGKSPPSFGCASGLSIVEMRDLLLKAGCSLSLRSEALRGEEGRADASAALRYCSFRCFSAVEVLCQALSGIDIDTLPVCSAVWRPILRVWMSVKHSRSCEEALASLSTWWVKYQEKRAGVVGGGAAASEDGESTTHSDALASLLQQAEWLRGEVAGDLQSEEAAGHLESTAEAMELVKGTLHLRQPLSGKRLRPVTGIGMPELVSQFHTESLSVYGSSHCILPAWDTSRMGVAAWTKSVKVGVAALATSAAASLQAERARLAGGYPPLVQRALGIAFRHSSIDGGPEDALGALTEVTVQVHCEKCWPLSSLVRDDAWADVAWEVRKVLCEKILGLLAVAEACDVPVGHVELDSFVVLGLSASTVEEFVDAFVTADCQVLLSACADLWTRPRTVPLRESLQVVFREIAGIAGAGARIGGSPINADDALPWCHLQEQLDTMLGAELHPCQTAYASACVAARAEDATLSSSDDEEEGTSDGQEEGGGGDAEEGTSDGQEKGTSDGQEEGGGGDAEEGTSDGQVLPDPSTGSGGGLSGEEEGTSPTDPARSSEAVPRPSWASEDVALLDFACRTGDLALVQEILRRQSSQAVPTLPVPEDAPPFTVACATGNVGEVRRMLRLQGEAAVDVHAADQSGPEAAFRMACANGHIDVVRILLSLGCRQEDESDAAESSLSGILQWAVESGDSDYVEEILARSTHTPVDVHAKDKNGPEAGFRMACSNGRTDVVRELLGLVGDREVDVHTATKGVPETAFRWACEGGRTDVVRELLALTGPREVDVHVDEESAFRVACRNGHVAVVQQLLALTGDRRVDVHVRNDAGFRMACVYHHKAVVDELLALEGDRAVAYRPETQGAAR